MKRLLIIAMISVVAVCVLADLGGIEPIEEKPTLVGSAEQWEMTGAYYQKVRMPDGTKQELKSRAPLTDKQWLALAEKVYIKPELLPEVCPYCGGLMP